MGASTLDEVRQRLVAARAHRNGDEEWVLGYGLEYNAFLQSGISGALIADAVDGAPSLLRLIDLHTGLATSRALELTGADGPRPFTENSEVVCDEAGRPTGELREGPAVALVQAAVPEPSEAERYALFAEALRSYAAVGLTRLHR